MEGVWSVTAFFHQTIFFFAILDSLTWSVKYIPSFFFSLIEHLSWDVISQNIFHHRRHLLDCAFVATRQGVLSGILCHLLVLTKTSIFFIKLTKLSLFHIHTLTSTHQEAQDSSPLHLHLYNVDLALHSKSYQNSLWMLRSPALYLLGEKRNLLDTQTFATL